MATLFKPTGTTNGAALTVKQWSPRLHQEIQEKLFWFLHGLMGPETAEDQPLERIAGHPIVQRTDLTKKKGDTVTVALMKKLADNFVTGVNTLTGTSSEQQAAFYNYAVHVEAARSAIYSEGHLEQQRSPIERLIPKYRAAIVDLMKQRIDNEIFYAFEHGYSSHIITEYTVASSTDHPNIMRPRNVAADTDIISSDQLTVRELERMAVYAEDNNFNPCDAGGEPHFVYVCHPYQYDGLRQDDRWREDTRMARERSEENPIWSYAKGVIAGIVLHTSTKVTSFVTGDGASNGRNGLLLGAHALAHAVARYPWVTEKDSDTDYGVKEGLAINCIWGDRRADWGSDDGLSTKLNQSSAIWKTFARNPNV